MAVLNAIKNVVVVGGSYVGRSTAQELAKSLPASHRVLLIEPHSHFHHLFTFPRFAIVPGHEHKAFVPYSGLFSGLPNAGLHSVIQAKVVAIQPRHVLLDRPWQGSEEIPFEYLAVATGTLLSKPAAMDHDDKPSSVAYLQHHQAALQRAKSIAIVGGGAVGVQMATDLGEFYGDKTVTLIQSRPKLMPIFHDKLHELIKARFDELGVRLVTGSRVAVPPGGFPNDGTEFDIQSTEGRHLAKTDFVILATGQTPNTSLLAQLDSAPDAAAATPTLPQSSTTSSSSLINPATGFVRVRPSLQFLDERYPHLFAVGDVADTGAQKAARPGGVQAGVVAKNIQSLIQGQNPDATYTPAPAAIHLSLGMKSNIIFRNPNPAEGQTEPTIIWRDDGEEDMSVEGFWQRLNVPVKNAQEYHL